MEMLTVNGNGNGNSMYGKQSTALIARACEIHSNVWNSERRWDEKQNQTTTANMGKKNKTMEMT